MDFSLDEEQLQFQTHLRTWVDAKLPKALARAWEADEDTFPVELWNLMAEQGLHAIGLPEEHGGSGGGSITQALIMRELSRTLSALSFVWGISSFCAKSVAKFAQADVVAELVPKLAAGEIRMSIAVTEPEGGTDVLGAMRTVATKVDGGWSLSGQKTWSTGAKASDYLLVLAKTDPDAAKPARGVSMFLVPNPSAGLGLTVIHKMGQRAMGSCEVFLDEVFVDDRYLVGEVNRGWYNMLDTLNNERILVAAMCVGAIDGVLEDALDYSMKREAFGRPIGQFQAIQHHIANIAMWQKQTELLTYNAAWLQDAGLPCGTESTMAKVVASELSAKAADLGIQILGGMGYSQETDMQRYWRDVRLFQIAPISNEMARNVIAESLGLPRSF